jgi:hypothetical protein
MRTPTTALAICVLAAMANGQMSDSLDATLSVVTEPEGAELSLDRIPLGRTPLEDHSVTPGRHTIEVDYPSAAEWNALRIRDTVVLSAGERVFKRYLLGTYVRVETAPPGAVVIRGDSALGLTPYVVRSPQEMTTRIVLRKDGFRDTTLVVGSRVQSVRILLKSETRAGLSAQRQLEFSGLENTSGSVWATYAAAASTIGFGVATAFLKHEANLNYDLYVSTDDPKYHDAMKKYDRAAVWTLVLTELSFGLLAYLLLAE